MLLGVVNFDLPPQNKWVGDLAPVLALGADAGVLAVHLDAGVRAFYLRQLLLHPFLRVRMQVGQPHSFLSAILANLCPRQQPTPDRFFAVFSGGSHVVGDLGTVWLEALEQGDAVLDQLNLRLVHAGAGALPRQVKGRRSRHARGRRLQLLVDQW